jgi:predicted nuclease with TOPRIM domain
VNALEEQLKASEQRNEERKQAQEVLSEELAEERRRFDEEKRKWAAQVEQLKERYAPTCPPPQTPNHKTRAHTLSTGM